MKRTELDRLENIDDELAEKLAQLCPPLDASAEEKLLRRVEKGLADEVEFEYEPEVTVSGADPYQKPGWRRFASTAAAVLLIAGLCGAGGLIMRKSGRSSPKAPSAASASDGTSYSTNRLTDTEASGTSADTSVTLTGTADATETKAVTTAVLTTVKKEKQPFEHKGTRVLRMNELTELAKKGEALTLADLRDYVCQDIGGSIYILKYYMPEGYTLLVGSEPGTDKVYYMNLYRGNKGGTGENYSPEESIDIRTESISDFISTVNKLNAFKDKINAIAPENVAKASYNYYSDGENYVIELDRGHINTALTAMKEFKLLYEKENVQEMLETLEKYNSKPAKWIFEMNDGTRKEISFVEDCICIDGEYWVFEKKYSDNSPVTRFNNLATDLYVSSYVHEFSDQEKCYLLFDKIRFKEGEYIYSENYKSRVKIKDIENTIFEYCFSDETLRAEKNGIETTLFDDVLNCYLLDMNNDCHADFCVTRRVTENGITGLHVTVYDAYNNKTYDLSGGGEYDYWCSYLYTIDNIVVFEEPHDSAVPFESNGTMGSIAINGDKLEFTTEEKVVGAEVTEVRRDSLLITTNDYLLKLAYGRDYISFELPMSYTEGYNVKEGTSLKICYSSIDDRTYPYTFNGITSVTVIAG